jgi:hypothetical protein
VNHICESSDEDALAGGNPVSFAVLNREVKTAAVGFNSFSSRRSPSFDYQIAIHEAGHVVAGRMLGLPVAGCTIEFIDGHFGLTWSDPKLCVNVQFADAETVESICAALMPLIADDRSDIAVELLQAHHQVISLLAGIEAERLLIGELLPNTEHDLREATCIAALIVRSPASIAAYLEFCRIETIALLTDHADTVLAIAGALVEHRTINAEQIGKILTVEKSSI